MTFDKKPHMAHRSQRIAPAHRFLSWKGPALMVLVGCLILTGCKSALQHPEATTPNNYSILGLWVSCPERTEIGPMFGELVVWREGRFDMRMLGRGPNQWRGTTVLAGTIDQDGRELVPDGDFEVISGERWTYEVIADDEMIIRHFHEDGIEETRMKRLE